MVEETARKRNLPFSTGRRGRYPHARERAAQWCVGIHARGLGPTEKRKDPPLRKDPPGWFRHPSFERQRPLQNRAKLRCLQRVGDGIISTIPWFTKAARSLKQSCEARPFSRAGAAPRTGQPVAGAHLQRLRLRCVSVSDLTALHKKSSDPQIAGTVKRPKDPEI